MLVVLSMALIVVNSPDLEVAAGMAMLAGVLGFPANVILGIVYKFLAAILGIMGVPGHMASSLSEQLYLFSSLYLAIPLNWGVLGFLISWWAGSSRESGRPLPE